MEFHRSDVNTVNSVFFANVATPYGGGGLHCWQSSPEIVNCTFSENSAVVCGGALSCFDNSNPVLTNCILWNDNAPISPEIYADGTSTPTIICCDIAGCGGSGAGWDMARCIDGGGNKDEDPVFVGAAGGDFHLDTGSPCIDTGYPGTTVTEDIEGNPRPAGSRCDMGAYEHQP